MQNASEVKTHIPSPQSTSPSPVNNDCVQLSLKDLTD
jgi:hypothetical protein